MSITIREVKTKKERNAFIYLPEKIHAQHPNWTPPLYADEERFFNPSKNVAFAHNKTVMYLAYEGEKVVGRIMGVIPLEYNSLKGINTARFSYFECYQSAEVFEALLRKVEQWARENGCTQMIGPMGFSDKEPQGFLTQGFEKPHMPVTNHSFEFMSKFMEGDGYQSFVELCQYDVPITKEMAEKYNVFAERVLSQLNVKVLEFTSTSQIKPLVKSVFDLINTTYTDIYGFTKITKEEADEFANRFLPLLNPRLIKILMNEKNEVVAFVIAMPNVNEGIKKAKGRLFPLGWFHILRAMKTSKRLVLLLGAVQNEMQNKGLDAVLAVKLLSSAINLGFKEMDSHLIMKENVKMRGIIERIEGHKMYKEYTIYSKNI